MHPRLHRGGRDGATLLTGGEGRPEGLEAGTCAGPTVFLDVHPRMRIAREEIFGPVLSVLTCRDDEEAVAVANGTDFGLMAHVLGEPGRACRVASRIRAARVAVNSLPADSDAPFGGFKQSCSTRVRALRSRRIPRIHHRLQQLTPAAAPGSWPVAPAARSVGGV
ncbi:aldehyde dehydrogenase family protein [Streptacidiphilus sp. N1-3]|uniref:Aldehyde dehydrogenase family protein n=1 Tax=Streptacidiphilus alkalitolerans TaxID=3342712 RepID=A0ABV6WZ80_9ACTN